MKFFTQTRPKLSICRKLEILRSFHLCQFCLPINPHHAAKSKKKNPWSQLFCDTRIQTFGPIFWAFGPVISENIKIFKKEKQSPLENMALHMCTKNCDICMFWWGDTASDRQKNRWKWVWHIDVFAPPNKKCSCNTLLQL